MGKKKSTPAAVAATETLVVDASSIEAPADQTPVVDASSIQAPADQTPVAVPQENPTEFGCPSCGANDSHLTPAGPEGTFLGDAILRCHACGESHNRHTRQPFALRTFKGKRVNLNPQPEIDAKVKAVEKVGGSLGYDRKARLWTLGLPDRPAVHMTGRQFAEFTAATITL
jgi:hypothetical protein